MMTDGSKFSPDLNKSKSIYFLEGITRSYPQSVQISGPEETSFFKVLRRLHPIFDELFNAEEVGQLAAELYSISNNSPYSWQLFEHLVEKLQLTELVVPQTILTAESLNKPTISSSIL